MKLFPNGANTGGTYGSIVGTSQQASWKPRHGKRIDLTVSVRQWLVKEGKTDKAAALVSIQAGALWCPARLSEAGIPHEGEDGHSCPLCGAQGVDECHLFSECTKVCPSRDAVIQKTNRYRSEYHRTGLSCKCYWWRGLQPKEQTQPIHEPQAS